MPRAAALALSLVLLLPLLPALAKDGPPAEGEARAQWIQEKLKRLHGGVTEREDAAKALVAADRDGDCIDPLIEMLPDAKKDVDLLRCLIRVLGRDGLEKAALPISEYLSFRDETIRADAAVSLEYIGSREKKVVTKLMKTATREKDEAIANHAYRAIGRCGVDNSSARSLLLKMAASGRSEYATFGPIIGLAYFDGDEKAMRGVEKILKQLGIPGGKRGAGQNTIKRGLLSWTLAKIGDKKSADFVYKELIEKLENVKAFWVDGLVSFWTSVADVCDGDDSKMPAIEGGLKFIVGAAKRWSPETARPLMDDYRKGRDNGRFTPVGDGLLEVGR